VDPRRLELDQGAEGIEEHGARHPGNTPRTLFPLADSFWSDHGDEVSAAITLLVAVAIAFLIDRFLIGRAERAAHSLDTGQFSREARTRLRLIRRLVFVVIIGIGVALALSQFASIKNFAAGVLASTAVLGIIIGFAGRQVIANLVGGVLMAFTQPIRIGDQVSIGDDVEGRVVDIALTYTSIDSGDGRLTVVPNEKVTTEVVVNHSAGNHRAPVLVDVWVRPDADVDAAIRALEGTEVTSVHVAELTVEGARLELKAAMEEGGDRATREAELREHAQRVLREAGQLRPL
jgi:small-conductance mechanosensitive channel